MGSRVVGYKPNTGPLHKGRSHPQGGDSEVCPGTPQDRHWCTVTHRGHRRSREKGSTSRSGQSCVGRSPQKWALSWQIPVLLTWTELRQRDQERLQRWSLTRRAKRGRSGGESGGMTSFLCPGGPAQETQEFGRKECFNSWEPRYRSPSATFTEFHLMPQIRDCVQNPGVQKCNI